MLDNRFHEAGAIAIFSGLSSVFLENPTLIKIAIAFVVALATGLGYTAGTAITRAIIAKLARAPAKTQ